MAKLPNQIVSRSEALGGIGDGADYAKELGTQWVAAAETLQKKTILDEQWADGRVGG